MLLVASLSILTWVTVANGLECMQYNHTESFGLYPKPDERSKRGLNFNRIGTETCAIGQSCTSTLHQFNDNSVVSVQFLQGCKEVEEDNVNTCKCQNGEDHSENVHNVTCICATNYCSDVVPNYRENLWSKATEMVLPQPVSTDICPGFTRTTSGSTPPYTETPSPSGPEITTTEWETTASEPYTESSGTTTDVPTTYTGPSGGEGYTMPPSATGATGETSTTDVPTTYTGPSGGEGSTTPSSATGATGETSELPTSTTDESSLPTSEITTTEEPTTNGITGTPTDETTTTSEPWSTSESSSSETSSTPDFTTTTDPTDVSSTVSPPDWTTVEPSSSTYDYITDFSTTTDYTTEPPTSIPPTGGLSESPNPDFSTISTTAPTPPPSEFYCGTTAMDEVYQAVCEQKYGDGWIGVVHQENTVMCFKLFTDAHEKSNYTEIQQYCVDNGAYVIPLTNEKEDQMALCQVEKALSRKENREEGYYFFLGAQKDGKGNFVWDYDHKPLSDNNRFGPNGNEECLAVQVTATNKAGTWVNYPCEGNGDLLGAICAKPLIPKEKKTVKQRTRVRYASA